MVTLTEKAAEKLQRLLEEEHLTEGGLRLYVTAGGCSGYSYGMAFEDGKGEDDEVYEGHGVRIFVDSRSVPLVVGAEIDYVDSLMGGGFSIRNPNAVSSCSCGNSFNTGDGAEGNKCC